MTMRAKKVRNVPRYLGDERSILAGMEMSRKRKRLEQRARPRQKYIFILQLMKQTTYLAVLVDRP